MIYSLWFRRYAPFKTFGGGFEGDDRAGPSILLTDSARTTAGVGFGPAYVGPCVASSSGTSFAGVGKTIERLLGRHSSNVRSSVTVSSQTTDTVRFVSSSAGANPMVPVAPAIDTFVHISAAFTATQLDLKGEIFGDDFPNAEVFIYDATGKGILLFHMETDGGQTTGPMTRLWGSHSRQRLGGFNTRIPLKADGAFSLPS